MKPNELSKDYVSCMNKVQDYIEKHIDEVLNIEKLAIEIFMSPYYFHRMYKLVKGESIYSYIKRVRLEKAMFLLRANKKKTITDIALSVGFSNSSSFAKAFKSTYGISATNYRNGKNGQALKISVGYNNIKALDDYLDTTSQLIPISVEVVQTKPKELIYTRNKGPYKGDADLFQYLFTKLYEWVNANGYFKSHANWLVMYHDLSHSHTQDDYLRISVCMEVDEPALVNGDIVNYHLDGGQYVVARYEVTTEEYQTAWDYMLFVWLRDNGYEHDDRLPYEAYPLIEASDKNKRVVDICIPVLKL